jgi:hypothetical protein
MSHSLAWVDLLVGSFMCMDGAAFLGGDAAVTAVGRYWEGKVGEC